MASTFAGYLFKTQDNTILDKYLVREGYSDTPDQRQDQNSYRDGAGELHRGVLPAVATTLVLKTLDGLTLEDITILRNAIRSGLLDEQERMVRLTYWNNEKLDYCTEVFYMPDMTFTIRENRGDTLIYNSLTLKFIGYGVIR